jgi:5-(carboxyamino)imidazole ribonucleotide synthase
MKAVWILGNGQLGQMLRQAGEPMGIRVYPLGFEEAPPPLPENALITSEIEQWPNTPLTEQLATHPGFVNRAALPLLADRLTQKQLLDLLGLPTAPWALLSSPEQWPALFAELGDTIVVKCRRGGYDGRGQWRVTADQLLQLPSELYGQAIVEQWIPFSGECSLVGARQQQNQVVFYPLTQNLHQAGILRASVTLPQPDPRLQAASEQMLQRLMHHLEYLGVMAMECFIVDGELMINELAPRVHNSGHWTQAGASMSQFALHLRALCDWPLPQPVVNRSSVMINLIGSPFNPAWLSHPLAQLHWYAKTVRPGRKVGHLNFSHSDRSLLQQAVASLQSLLSEETYLRSLQWIQEKLVDV